MLLDCYSEVSYRVRQYGTLRVSGSISSVTDI
jgi:hypothetical protein